MNKESDMGTAANFDHLTRLIDSLSLATAEGEETTWQTLHSAICDILEGSSLGLVLFAKIYGDSAASVDAVARATSDEAAAGEGVADAPGHKLAAKFFVALTRAVCCVLRDNSHMEATFTSIFKEQGVVDADSQAQREQDLDLLSWLSESLRLAENFMPSSSVVKHTRDVVQVAESLQHLFGSLKKNGDLAVESVQQLVGVSKQVTQFQATTLEDAKNGDPDKWNDFPEFEAVVKHCERLMHIDKICLDVIDEQLCKVPTDTKKFEIYVKALVQKESLFLNESIQKRITSAHQLLIIIEKVADVKSGRSIALKDMCKVWQHCHDIADNDPQIWEAAQASFADHIEAIKEEFEASVKQKNTLHK